MLADVSGKDSPLYSSHYFIFFWGLYENSLSQPLCICMGPEDYLWPVDYGDKWCVALPELAPKDLVKSPLLSLLLRWIQRSLPLQIIAAIIQVIQGDVAWRTTWPETSTLNYGIEQMNLCCLKMLRFCGCLFLCYHILIYVTLLYGLFNDAHLLRFYTFCSRVANYDISLPANFWKYT